VPRDAVTCLPWHVTHDARDVPRVTRDKLMLVFKGYANFFHAHMIVVTTKRIDMGDEAYTHIHTHAHTHTYTYKTVCL
jgi:hypothetical protein